MSTQQENKRKDLMCWGWIIIMFSITDLIVNIMNNKDYLMTADISNTVLVITLVVIGVFTLIELIAGIGLLKFANGGSYSKFTSALLVILFIVNLIGLASIIYGATQGLNDAWSVGFGLRGTLVALFALIYYKKYKNV